MTERIRDTLRDWRLRLRVPPIRMTGILGWRTRRRLIKAIQADLRATPNDSTQLRTPRTPER